MSFPSHGVPNLATALTGPLLQIEELFLTHQVAIESWFRQQWKATSPPFYGSVDLRNAGFKLAPVDTNLFPAGFNNLNPDFLPLCVQAVQATIAEICPDVTRLLVIPESHSRNQFYFESLARLVEILFKAGFDVRVGSLDESLTTPIQFTGANGQNITISPLVRRGDQVGLEDFFPCCIILNNDLSGEMPEKLKGLNQTIFPSAELGWSNRLKSKHFKHYQKVAEEFSQILKIDPWLISPLFEQCAEVDFMTKGGQDCLVERCEKLLTEIKKKYKEHKIELEPFLVVKADAGTYGMAVMMIRDPKELLNLNRKQRTRMSFSKGGVLVTKTIIQEGVYTFETSGETKAVAEPVVYLIGRHVVGGFYRLHKNRKADENLNAPGMDFQPLAFAQSCYSANRFYVYSVIARLAFVAAARELCH